MNLEREFFRNELNSLYRIDNRQCNARTSVIFA